MNRLGAALTTLLLGLVVLAAVVVPAPAAMASCSTAGCPAPVPCDTGVGACWNPGVGLRWQYQLQGSHASQGCNFASTGGINVGISAVPANGGNPVQPQVF